MGRLAWTMAWRGYVNRSLEAMRDKSTEIFRAQPFMPSDQAKLQPLVRLASTEDLSNFATGCDSDIGGTSTATLDLGPEGKGRFWGRLSSELQQGRKREGVIERGGYAGFRNKTRTAMFGTRHWDISLHDYLRLRIKSSGDGMRYFVNIQTDGPVRSDLFQHRLWPPTPASAESPHEWSDVLVPLADFTLTNSGNMSETQISMMREKIRTVGVSVLGPKEGRFELGIERIDAVSRGWADETDEPSAV